MIKLALAVGFVAVFGYVAVVIITFILSSFRDTIDHCSKTPPTANFEK